MQTLTIPELMTEVWDRYDSSIYDNDSDNVDMQITIYRGSSQSPDYSSLDINYEEALLITGLSNPQELIGYTEWHLADSLLVQNLPLRVRNWANQIIGEFTNLPADEVDKISKIALAFDAMSKQG